MSTLNLHTMIQAFTLLIGDLLMIMIEGISAVFIRLPAVMIKYTVLMAWVMVGSEISFDNPEDGEVDDEKPFNQ